MEGTSDEAFHWKSRKGEEKMYRKGYRLEEILEASETPERKLRRIVTREQADLARWADEG
ncbi:hypothetical protein AKJ41_06520 [candidate division MSBL1 archaeon SCGC-AAA259O05]|uniref:Uncharacterized protein n=1 Tax=candidate division MSBL1 archaeon SCGC-AAA259O05 TaxID=1698271 RepID=A0A133UWH1_9EURY|nr:hypothetical protein AKJ41_06520 [candidate division MSBL1 archaeon SCGC-AAA259O05]